MTSIQVNRPSRTISEDHASWSIFCLLILFVNYFWIVPQFFIKIVYTLFPPWVVESLCIFCSAQIGITFLTRSLCKIHSIFKIKSDRICTFIIWKSFIEVFSSDSSSELSLLYQRYKCQDYEYYSAFGLAQGYKTNLTHLICLPNVLNEKDEIVDRYLPYIDCSPSLPSCPWDTTIWRLLSPFTLSPSFEFLKHWIVILGYDDVIVCPKDNGEDCACLNGTADMEMQCGLDTLGTSSGGPWKLEGRLQSHYQCVRNMLQWEQTSWWVLWRQEVWKEGHLWRVWYNPQRKQWGWTKVLL